MKIKIKKFRSVRSTNDVAIKLIKRNVDHSMMIIADKQTKGRGTRGRKWISPKGNLFMSIYFKLDQKGMNFKQFAILNAFLLRKLILKNIHTKIKIKWPNDLLVNREKICGILQEVINFKKSKFLIVGIGINTNIEPKNKGFQSTCLKNIINKKISNKIILKNIKEGYEKFLIETKRFSFSKLKRKYK